MKIDNNIVVKCKNLEEVKDCLNKLEELGFETKKMDEDKSCLIVSSSVPCRTFFYNYETPVIDIDKNVVNYDYFFKLYKKQKEEEKKVKDFEVASDGKVIKINNKESEKQIFVVYDEAYNYDYEYYKENGMKIVDMAQNYLDFIVKYGIAYATKEARDRALFKIEIETKLKNIAERLNKGQEIDWENGRQEKFTIYYDYKNKTLCNYDNAILCYSFECFCKSQGTIYCLDENFLNVAKQEIGEDKLIKYFKE